MKEPREIIHEIIGAGQRITYANIFAIWNAAIEASAESAEMKGSIIPHVNKDSILKLLIK